MGVSVNDTTADTRIVTLSVIANSRKSRPMMSPMKRSEEHTSELQSQSNLVCRLLLEKKKNERCLSRARVEAERSERADAPPTLHLAGRALTPLVGPQATTTSASSRPGALAAPTVCPC